MTISTILGRGNDLIRWEIKIEHETRHREVFGNRYNEYEVGPPEATIILHAITQTECEAVISLINTMRSSPSRTVPAPVKLGDRFSGLDLSE